MFAELLQKDTNFLLVIFCGMDLHFFALPLHSPVKIIYQVAAVILSNAELYSWVFANQSHFVACFSRSNRIWTQANQHSVHQPTFECLQKPSPMAGRLTVLGDEKETLNDQQISTASVMLSPTVPLTSQSYLNGMIMKAIDYFREGVLDFLCTTQITARVGPGSLLSTVLMHDIVALGDAYSSSICSSFS